MKKRGQVSIEFVITVGFALLMIIPITIIAYEHISETYYDVNNNQAGLIARKITDNANSVYYLGYPSSVTMKVYMPENIQSINVSGREVIFNLEKGTEVVSAANVNLSGKISPSSGLRYIRISALKYNTNNSWVNISEDVS
jgi:hypothetical protein